MHTRIAPIGEYKIAHITTIGTVVPVGVCVSTTAPTTITAGAGVVVTPVSMANIVVGMWLNVANGTGTAEDVQVLSISSPTTFTANFANNHSGAYNITSRTGTYLGPIIVGQAGTSMVLTLYDGSPYVLPNVSKVIGVLSLTAGDYDFAARCDQGLFYTLAGTPGDITLQYLDYAPGGQ